MHTHTNTLKNTVTACIIHRDTVVLHTYGELPVLFPPRKLTISQITHTLTKSMFLYNLLKYNYKKNKPNKQTLRRWKGKVARFVRSCLQALERSFYSVCSDWNRKWNRDSRLSSCLSVSQFTILTNSGTRQQPAKSLLNVRWYASLTVALLVYW